MIKENQAEFELANIVKYQQMPVKRDPGLIIVLDSSNRPRKHDGIQIAIDNFRDDDKPGHNTQVCGVIRQVAPDANIVTFNYFGSEKPKIIDWIIENKKDICVVNCSFTSGDKEIERLEEHDITVVSSSGNTSQSITYPASLPWITSVGAFEEWNYKVADYSSYGETLDIVAFTNIFLMVDPETNKVHWFNGTSCSGPVSSAMLWLYQSRHGIKFTREQARRFLHMNTIDLLEKGHDAKSGYGLFILPEKIETQEEGSETMFTDINDRYEESQEAIKWAIEKGYMKGYAGQREGEFGPTEPVTREQFAIAIKRIVEGGD